MPSSAASLSISGVSVSLRPRQPQNSEPRLSSRMITEVSDVAGWGRRLLAPNRLAVLHKLRVRLGQQAARAPVSFLLRHGLVERAVIEVMRPCRGKEGDGAVVATSFNMRSLPTWGAP